LCSGGMPWFEQPVDYTWRAQVDEEFSSGRQISVRVSAFV